MSQWRKLALGQVPSCKRSIEEAESPSAMWTQLYLELEMAYETDPSQEETIGQIYGYAFKCLYDTNHDDMNTAVVCAFFEHLPTHDKVSKDLYKRISREDFQGLESVFHYFLNDDEFTAFKGQFLSAKAGNSK